MGVKQIKNLAERMRAESVFRAVVVAQVAMTPFARQCLTEMAPKYTIEVVSCRAGGGERERESRRGEAACGGTWRGGVKVGANLHPPG